MKQWHISISNSNKEDLNKGRTPKTVTTSKTKIIHQMHTFKSPKSINDKINASFGVQ
jgi:hypothetical protein